MFGPLIKKSALAAAVLAATCMATPASAAQFLFDYSGEGEFGTDNVTGTLTVADTANQFGGSLITGISGTINGIAIDGLLAPGAFQRNDNLLFPNNPILLSFDGFSFSAGGTQQNIFGAGGAGEIYALAFRSTGNFTIQQIGNPQTPAIPGTRHLGADAARLRFHRWRAATAADAGAHRLRLKRFSPA